jgi:uncharacterized protein (DUF362 family)
MIGGTDVGIFFGETIYHTDRPYSPGEAFPEYPFGPVPHGAAVNHAYRAVRGALKMLRLDALNLDRPNWNPLGSVITPGETVVLKPNFVRDFRESSPIDGDCLITHGSVIRAVLDYVYIALEGRGRIVVADAPQNDADFEAIRRIAGLSEIQRFYEDRAGFKIEVYDLRRERAHKVDGVIVGHTPLPGDPAGYVRVDLGHNSAFAEISHLCHLLYGAEYDTGELRKHHHADTHEYLISKTVLDADVVMGIPKLKTHKKVGLTVNMKNLVGINGNKNWLPHYRAGTSSQGGDQFQQDGVRGQVERRVLTCFKRWFPLLGAMRPLVARPVKSMGKRLFGDTDRGTTRSGNWYGNDTAWRMVLDLNRILFYADSDGRLHDQPVRKFFSIVDGIVSGEGNGPLDPTPKQTGVVLAGTNPVAVDLACARMMGFEYRRIPMLHRAFANHRLPLASFGFQNVVGGSNDQRFDRPLAEMRGSLLAFKPHFGWKGHVEIAELPATDGWVASCAG